MKSIFQKTIISALIFAAITPALHAQGWRDWFTIHKSLGIGAGVGAAAALWSGYSWYATNNKLKELQKKKKQTQQEIEQLNGEIEKNMQINNNECLLSFRADIADLKNSIIKNANLTSDDAKYNRITVQLGNWDYAQRHDFARVFHEYINKKSQPDEFIQNPDYSTPIPNDNVQKNELIAHIGEIEHFSNSSTRRSSLTLATENRKRLIQNSDEYAQLEHKALDTKRATQIFTGTSIIITVLTVYKNYLTRKITTQ